MSIIPNHQPTYLVNNYHLFFLSNTYKTRQAHHFLIKKNTNFYIASLFNQQKHHFYIESDTFFHRDMISERTVDIPSEFQEIPMEVSAEEMKVVDEFREKLCSGEISTVAMTNRRYLPYTLWLFNIAMENGPFIDGLPIKMVIFHGYVK